MSQEKARSLGIAIAKWTKNRNSVAIKTVIPFFVTAVSFSVKVASTAINFIADLYDGASPNEKFYDKGSTYSKSTPISSRILEEQKYPFDIHV